MRMSVGAASLAAGPRKKAVLFGILAATLAAAMLPGAAVAQKPSPFPGLQKSVEKPEAEPAREPAHDPLGRLTPFGTVLGFIKAAEGADLNRAVDYLNVQLIPKRARKLVEDLAAVLDAADLHDLTRDPEGDLEDGLPPDRERVGVVKTGSVSREIILERVHRGNEPPIWLFSADTLKWVPRVRGELDVGRLERLLSGTKLDTRILGYPIWRLIGAILVLPFSFVVGRLVGGFLVRAIPPVIRRAARRPVEYRAARLKWPISLLTMAAIFYVISILAFSAASRVYWGYVAATVATIAGTWMGLRLLDDVSVLIGEGPQPRLGSGGIAMARLLSRLSKVLMVFFGAMILLSIGGINLTAVIAGVSIGGIALALAAQKSLENLIGVMTILSDKPIRVGDFCKVGEFTGTVEDIGIRSTRIRTVGRTTVTVPNGQLITMSLENYSTREKVLITHRIHLGYETTAEQLRSVLAGIRTVLTGHPKIEAPTARANLSAFRDASIDVEIFAYLLETSYETFLAVQEELLLRTMEIVSASGAKFALPLPAPPAAREQRGVNR